MSETVCSGAAPRNIVVIPAFDEEATIASIVEEVRIQGYPVIVVNDASLTARVQPPGALAHWCWTSPAALEPGGLPKQECFKPSGRGIITLSPSTETGSTHLATSALCLHPSPRIPPTSLSARARREEVSPGTLPGGCSVPFLASVLKI